MRAKNLSAYASYAREGGDLLFYSPAVQRRDLEAKHMSLWRREAIQRFPELQRKIADVEGPFLLWVVLRQDLFLPAYAENPPDRETASRVYEYAAWSLKQRSLTVRLAAADGFYEWLAYDPRTLRDLPVCLSREDFENLRFARDHMEPYNYAVFQQASAKSKNR